MWSACSPSILTIRVRIPLDLQIFCKMFVEKKTILNKMRHIKKFSSWDRSLDFLIDFCCNLISEVKDVAGRGGGTKGERPEEEER